jgi:aryl-alcohol dehydrogenase-like predicted oxidoreductase
MKTRILGRSGMEVSALGLGCWAIGGPFWKNGEPVGWGEVDDQESTRAIRRARELGITFFDTADIYGVGHSETLLGEVLHGERDQVVIATKFGNTFDAAKRISTGRDFSREYIRQACEASLRRLQTDYIDLYQIHPKEMEHAQAMEVCAVLEELVSEGKIRYYGWSTDDPERAAWFQEGEHYASVQHNLNVFEDNPEMIAVCEDLNLASVNRGPLARGLLTGKFNRDSSLPSNDVRSKWDFKDGLQAERLEQLDELRPILTRDGRTLTQAAIGWLWARSPQTIPIPGFKTVQQVEETIGAIRYGPLPDDQMQEIADYLKG